MGKRLLLLGLLLGGWVGAARAETVWIDRFEGGLAPRWEEKTFKGRTLYDVVAEGSGHVLRARSQDAASGLIYRTEYDLTRFPRLAWRWKVENILQKGDARSKAGDDYSARVYVIFPHWFAPKTRSINYIWANRLPRGTFVPNPFFGNAVMLAVQSGPERVGEWISEERDVAADYRTIFGEEPPLAGGVAIMTDTDNTGEAAVAYYDDLRLLSAPSKPNAP
jgi:Protein of unknown function (DUF3047)